MLTGHCKPFSASCKEGFQNFFEKFQKKTRGRQNDLHKPAKQGKKRLKQPHHSRAQRQKIQDRREPHRQKQIQPELPAAVCQREQQNRRGEQQPKQHVRRKRPARASAPEGAQRVIAHAQPEAEQRPLREGQGLLRNGDLHQPKSLAKKPPRAAVAACVLVFAGIGCFVADGLAAGTLLGNALGLGSGVAYAGVFLVNTEPEGDAMSSYFLGQVAGALIGLPFLSGETDFSFVPMVCIFALGVFQLGLSYVLIARGIATTPPMTASLVTAIEPILTPVWVALAYGERLSGFSLAGAVLVLCSVVWFNTRGRKAL